MDVLRIIINIMAMSNKRIIRILFICSLIGFCFFLFKHYPWYQKQLPKQATIVPPSVKLTEDEQLWLKAHQPVHIAFDGYFPPYSFINESGKLDGISYDIIQLISQKLKIQLEIDKRNHWRDIYQAALDGEIDVIATMVKRPAREFQFVFTQPYVFKSLVIVTHNSNQQLKQRSDLAGKTVAIVKGYQYSENILKEFPSVTPYYVKTMHDGLVAVETKQVDAAISYFAATYFIQNKYLLSHIKVAAFYDRNSANESIAVRKDLAILAGIFQKGLDSISVSELQLIKSKWYPPIKKPIDYQTIRNIVSVFLSILIFLVLWISQIKYQSRKIKITKNKLLVTNHELNDLKHNLENQVRQRTKQLENSERKYRSLVENLRDEYFFYKHDLNGNFTYLSPSFTSILGYNTTEGLNHYSRFFSDHEDNSKVLEYKALSLQGEKLPAYEIEIFDKKGKIHRLCLLETPLYDELGQCSGIEGLAHDVTELKQIQDKLNRLSYYDELTGLANRRLFAEKLEQLITLSHRNKQSLALLFLDLNRFKIINDTFGHAIGDEVLIETAKRLKAELRDSDVSARMGGDEFTLILPNTDVKAAENVAHKVLQSLLEPYLLQGENYTVGTSIGIAIYPDDSTEAAKLLQLADIAMYHAKKAKIGCSFYSPSLK